MITLQTPRSSAEWLTDTGHVLLRQIRTGRYPEGSLLPPPADLVYQLGVSELVMQAATGQLLLSGVLQLSGRHLQVAPRRSWRIRVRPLEDGAIHLAEALLRQIDQGEYPVGCRLPAIHHLVRQHQVHPAAARDALRLLAAKGRLALQSRQRALVLAHHPYERPESHGELAQPVLHPSSHLLTEEPSDAV